MFLQTQRMSGRGSKITVIEPCHYLDFFKELKGRQDIELWFKAYLAVSVSGGCRVSETLSIKAGEIDSQGHFKVRVLKKRTEAPIYRPCILSPDALSIVQEYINTKQLTPFERLFKFNRSTVHRQIKKHFGSDACSHSISRHSHISWLLHNLNIPIHKVAVEMAMLTHVVDAYNHANIEVEQANRFKKPA